MAHSSNPLRRVTREVRRFRRRLQRHPTPKPLQVPLGRDALEVHSLVCARDVPMSLWSLRSFIAFSGLLPTVVIHDDGSLTAKHRRLFQRHFDGITVLDDRTMSARMESQLATWPACRRARRLPAFYCSRKLLDILFAAQSEQVLYIDSDILFFQRPVHLLEHAAAGTPCFSADYQSAYSTTVAELEQWAGRRVEPRVNAGLLQIPITPYRERLALIERFLLFSERTRPTDRDVNRKEQTSHALVMSDLEAARLPPTYALSGGIDDSTISYHFVNDGKARWHLWAAGIPRIAAEVSARLRKLCEAHQP